MHGSEAPAVSDRELTSLEFDMHRALEEYLQFAETLGATRRSQLQQALEGHEDREALLDWLKARDPERWTDYGNGIAD